MFFLSFSCLLKIRWSKSLKYSFQTPVYTDHVDLALELLVSFNWFMVQEDAALLICSPIDILLALRLPQMLGPGFHWVISPDSCRRQLPCQAHMKCLCWTVLSPGTEPYQTLYVGSESWVPEDELWDVCNNQKIKAKTVVSMERSACFKETSCTTSLYYQSVYFFFWISLSHEKLLPKIIQFNCINTKFPQYYVYKKQLSFVPTSPVGTAWLL